MPSGRATATMRGRLFCYDRWPEKPCPAAHSYSYSSFVLDSFEYEYEEEDEDESEFPCLMLCSNWRRQRPDWNLIRETVSLSSGTTITRTYLWGHDLTGWRSGQYDQEAGGIGGLLAISVATNAQAAVAYFPVTDGQGNIRYLVDGSGNVVAGYDYDPFGTLIAESGAAKGVCPFRFSSKYYDSETGLLYFGYRFFDSRTAKWLSVDPLGEAGGVNQTAYCLNDPVNGVDPVGLVTRAFVRDLNDPLLEDYMSTVASDPENYSLHVQLNKTDEEFLAEVSKYSYYVVFDEGVYENEFVNMPPVMGNVLRRVGSRPARALVFDTNAELDRWLKTKQFCDALVGALEKYRFVFSLQMMYGEGLSQLQHTAKLRVHGLRISSGKGAVNDAIHVPGRVQSRINLSNDGMRHVIERHLSGKPNASQFNISETELRALLTSKQVVLTPVTRTLQSADGIRYVRDFDAGRLIGLDAFSGNRPTSIMTILTDKFGNLVTATPGVIK